MWKAATSTHPRAWEREMHNIKEVNEEAFKYLIAIPPRLVIHITDSVMIGPNIGFSRLTKD